MSSSTISHTPFSLFSMEQVNAKAELNNYKWMFSSKEQKDQSCPCYGIRDTRHTDTLENLPDLSEKRDCNAAAPQTDSQKWDSDHP